MAAIGGAICLLAPLALLSPTIAGATPPAGPVGIEPSRTIGHAPAIPIGSVNLGPTPQSGTVSFDVVLASRSASALQAFAQAVSDPEIAAVR